MSEKVFEILSTAVLEGDSEASTAITQQGLDEGISAEDLLNDSMH